MLLRLHSGRSLLLFAVDVCRAVLVDEDGRVAVDVDARRPDVVDVEADLPVNVADTQTATGSGAGGCRPPTSIAIGVEAIQALARPGGSFLFVLLVVISLIPRTVPQRAGPLHASSSHENTVKGVAHHVLISGVLLERFCCGAPEGLVRKFCRIVE